MRPVTHGAGRNAPESGGSFGGAGISLVGLSVYLYPLKRGDYPVLG